MTLTIGIVQDAGAGVGLADCWPRTAAGGPQILVSPPAAIDQMGPRCSLVLVTVADERLPAAIGALRPFVGASAAVVSTSMAIPLHVLRSMIGPGPALFRAVIPLGAEPGEGVVALAPEQGTSPEAVEDVRSALSLIGAVETVAEDALDAVAALALGGACFLAEALQGLEEGAVRDGLPRGTARAFAHQTALATALLLRSHAGSPADLKDQVASPGGTTIAALATLEDAGVRGAYIRAVERTALGLHTRRDAARSRVIE